MITLDDLKASTLRQSMHLDGPRGKNGWFADRHQCIQFPRLQRQVTYYRATKGHKIKWMVDGVDVGETLESALDALNTPSVLTDADRTALEQVGEDWADLRKVLDYGALRSLTDKGLIEMDHGKCRRAKP